MTFGPNDRPPTCVLSAALCFDWPSFDWPSFDWPSFDWKALLNPLVGGIGLTGVCGVAT
ncbi:MAG: hypothetical protein AAF562_07555 [Pseudomonadota bacterium]